MKVDILGIKVDDLSTEETVGKVLSWLNGKTKRYIVTPNPEFVMAAQSDQDFAKILNNADLAIPDGVGFKVLGKTKNRTTGTDLVENLCKVSAEKGFTVGFLGGREGVAKEAAECLSKKYPGLKISLAEDGPEVDGDGNEVVSSKYKVLSKKLNTKYLIPNTDILFVGFGQVKQEKWIAKNLPKIPVKVAIGVGGAFDYLSGTIPRAPYLLRVLGFEWLFRLIIQPWRVKRQWVIIRFIFSLLFDSLRDRVI